MPRENVTLTLQMDRLQELRELVGASSLSAAVDNAIRAYIDRVRHLVAVDEWLVELEREHGPVPPETLEWAPGWSTHGSRNPPSVVVAPGEC